MPSLHPVCLVVLEKIFKNLFTTTLTPRDGLSSLGLWQGELKSQFFGVLSLSSLSTKKTIRDICKLIERQGFS